MFTVNLEQDGKVVFSSVALPTKLGNGLYAGGKCVIDPSKPVTMAISNGSPLGSDVGAFIAKGQTTDKRTNVTRPVGVNCHFSRKVWAQDAHWQVGGNCTLTNTKGQTTIPTGPATAQVGVNFTKID